MNLVNWLQNSASEFLTFIFSIFDYFGQISFFIWIFAIFYLFIDKGFAYKYFLAYQTGFIFSTLFLKNIIKRQRPYAQDDALLSNRNSYGFSLPNERTMTFALSSCALLNVSKGSKKIYYILLASFILSTIAVTFGQLYFAEAFLLDCIVGIAIGVLIYSIIFKFVKVTNKTYFIGLIVSLVSFVVIAPFILTQSFTNNFSNAHVFEFLGLIISFSVGCYIENKYIKYKVKNNIILTSFNALITTIVLLGCHFIDNILPGIVIFSFLKYLFIGFIVTVVLPLLFKVFQKYLYIFTNNVQPDKVEMSHITIGEGATKRLAKRLSKTLKSGDVVLLSGDLGAGKSVLVRQILKTYGVKSTITSPTFTIVNQYNTPKCKCYHFDMYRLTSEEEAINIGFEEILDDKTSIKFIEWPQNVENLLPNVYKKITITKLSKKCRNIVLENYVNQN
ncbi:MAG: tRNA (adenosine(37)-N6)-threonylcarbamoyltransferase complex ATPase subunit type 1 TsaE [Clostridia bacterium]|nr:tRNA (adenosine(37)-N6)-threonylcarbamoyltransferase complex ATPase subunit type 1 TsaE [Clostridia bacterium]